MAMHWLEIGYALANMSSRFEKMSLVNGLQILLMLEFDRKFGLNKVLEIRKNTV